MISNVIKQASQTGGEPSFDRPLRIGVMLDGLDVPNWMYRTLAQIQNSSFADIQLLILNGSQSAETPVTGLKVRLKDIYKRGVFNRYYSWDYNRNQPAEELDAFASKDATELLQSVARTTVTPIQKKFTDRFEKADVESIRSHNLDVVLRFGFRIIRGSILDVANYGVWSYHHGDNREYRGGPALFWEIYERNPVSGVVLQILSDKLDGGRVLYRSLAATEMNSLYLNRNPIFWKGSQLIPRRLRDLHQFGWEFIESLDTYDESIPYKKGIYRTPTSPRMLLFLARRFMNGVCNQVCKRLFRDHWFCAIGSYPQNSANDEPHEWNNVEANDPTRFFADPFLIERNDKTWVFAEELPYQTNKGLISVSEVTNSQQLSPFRVVMDEDVHLSYPAVFEHEGEIYMTPETEQAKQVRLYRATNFPNEWTLDTVLLDNVGATDPTIYQEDGTFYLFTNIPPKGASYNDELHLYFADDLRGPWRSHPLNPIKSDVQSSRPAGHLFRNTNGDLIRPSQDCSVRYGYAITLNRVTKLSRTEYAEESMKHLSPDWCRGKATHTINRTANFEVRDGQVRRWLWT